MLRLLRVVLGVILLVGAGWAMVPHLISIVGTSGVVNAPLLTLRSPIDGTVASASRSLGAGLRRGEALLVVEGSRLARDALEEAEMRARTLIHERDALQAQLTAVESQMEDLENRAALHRGMAVAWLGERAKAVEARAEALASDVAILRNRLERAQALEGGAVSTSQRLELEHELAAREADYRGIRAEAAALRVEQEATERGVALDLGAGEGLYARQTLDSHRLQRAELQARLARVSRDLEAVETRIAQARATLDRQIRFAPAAPAAGAIWANSPAEGSAVMMGDVLAQILDCDQRFLEVTVSERHFGRLELGTRASVRLRGSDDWRAAQVVSMMGAGALIREGDFAARPRNLGAGELRVILTYTDTVAESSRYCDVGRSVDVRFQSPTLVTEAWTWLTGGGLKTRLARIMGAEASQDPSAHDL